VIEQYDGAPAVREALQIMIESYDRLNLQPLARQTRQVYQANYAGEVAQSQAEIRNPVEDLVTARGRTL